MSDFHNETIVKKSRKGHKCCSCSSLVEAGGSYSKIFGVWGGEIYKHKLCLSCNEIITDLFASGDYGDGIDYEQVLWEINPDKEYYEILQKIPNKSDVLKKLLARWEDDLNLQPAGGEG